MTGDELVETVVQTCPICGKQWTYTGPGHAHESHHAALYQAMALIRDLCDLSTHHYGTGLWDDLFPEWQLRATSFLDSLSAREPAEDSRGVRGNSGVREPSRGVEAHRRSDNMAPVAPPVSERADPPSRIVTAIARPEKQCDPIPAVQSGAKVYWCRSHLRDYRECVEAKLVATRQQLYRECEITSASYASIEQLQTEVATLRVRVQSSERRDSDARQSRSNYRRRGPRARSAGSGRPRDPAHPRRFPSSRIRGDNE